MKNLIPLLLLLLAKPAFATNRTIMEGIAASRNTIMVSTANYRVGIGTSAPMALLDVAGNAQFGQGAFKSTFTATGDLTMATNADLTLTGPTAYATFPASVTASSFWGNGAGLTGTTGMLVPAANVQAGSLGAAVIASSIAVVAVGTEQMVNAAVDTSKLGIAAVTTVKIAPLAVDTSKVATDAVNNVKLLSDAASLAKVSGGAMSASGNNITHIANGSINLSGASGNIIGQSSFTTTGSFFGDGSHLTGIAGTISGLSTGKSVYATNSTTLASGNDVVTASSDTFTQPVLFSGLATFSGGASGAVHWSSATLTGDQTINSGTLAFITQSSTTLSGITIGTEVQCWTSIELRQAAGAELFMTWVVDGVQKPRGGSEGSNCVFAGIAAALSGADVVNCPLSFIATSTSHTFSLLGQAVTSNATLNSTDLNGIVHCRSFF